MICHIIKSNHGHIIVMSSPFPSPIKIVIITPYHARRPTRNEKKLISYFIRLIQMKQI